MGAEAPLNLSNCELTCNRAESLSWHTGFTNKLIREFRPLSTMNSSHWLRYAHQKLIDLDLPCPGFSFNYSFSPESLILQPDLYDQVELLSMQDFLKGRVMRNKRKYVKKKLDIIVNQDGFPDNEEGWEWTLQLPFITIEVSLDRIIFPFTGDSPGQPASYRSYNFLCADIISSKTNMKALLSGRLGSDFGSYEIPWFHTTSGSDVELLVSAMHSTQRSLQEHNTSEKEQRRRYLSLTPEKYINNFFCKPIADVYKFSTNIGVG